MGSVFLYLTMFGVASLFLFNSKISKTKSVDIWFVLAILIPVTLAALRDQVGTDFNSYVYMYNRNARLSFWEWFQSSRSLSATRFGIWAISQIAFLFDSQEVFFGLLSFWVVFPVALRLKLDFSKTVSTQCYYIYLSTLYMSGLNTCKQAAAVAILFWGIRFVYERKLVKYIIVVCMASLMHITALVAIFIYFMYDPRKKMLTIKKSMFVIGSIGVIAVIPNILKFLGGRFAAYIVYEGSVSNKIFYLNLCWCLVFWIFYRSYVKIDSRNSLFLIMMVIALVLEVTGFYSPYIKRIALYYSFPQFLLIGQLPQVITNPKMKLMVKMMLYVYVITIFIVQFYIFKHSDVIPYNYVGGNL